LGVQGVELRESPRQIIGEPRNPIFFPISIKHSG